MTFAIIAQIILMGVALSMDAFAVAVTDGLTYTDINKKRSFFIAAVFGVMQAAMPLIGYWLVESIGALVGKASAGQAGDIMSAIVTWVAFALLMFIGGKMLYEGITFKEDAEEKPGVGFVALMIQGIATSIDALSVGFTIADYDFLSAALAAFIIALVTFVICMGGLIIGKKAGTALSGKATVFGGMILIFIGLEIFISGIF